MKRRALMTSMLIVVLLLLSGCGQSVTESSESTPEEKGVEYSHIDIQVGGVVAFQTDDQAIVDEVFALWQMTLDPENKVEKDSVASYSIVLSDGEENALTFDVNGHPVGREAYLMDDSGTYALDYDAFRYMKALVDFREMMSPVTDDEVIRLFGRYGWTLDFMIAKQEVTLPESLVYEAGDWPYALYWAYNNDLSRAVGYDYSEYVGQTVTVEMYRVRESLAETFGPNRSARAIVLKDGEKIIGAYLDRGRSGFACALDGTLPVKDFAAYANLANPYEVAYGQMDPEDVIRVFYAATASHDEAAVISLYSKSRLAGLLHLNIDMDQLYNHAYPLTDNIISAEIVSIEPFENAGEGYVEYAVTLEMDYVENRYGMEPDGENLRFVVLEEEIEGTGYRISGAGTGP